MGYDGFTMPRRLKMGSGAKDEAYRRLQDRLAAQGRDLGAVVAALAGQRIEVPSWGFADTGTRFGKFFHQFTGRICFKNRILCVVEVLDAKLPQHGPVRRSNEQAKILFGARTLAVEMKVADQAAEGIHIQNADCSAKRLAAHLNAVLAEECFAFQCQHPLSLKRVLKNHAHQRGHIGCAEGRRGISGCA